MPQNNISEMKDYISDETAEEIAPATQNAKVVVLDPSTPSIRSIVRVVLITLVLLFFAGFVQNILSSLTYLFFLIILAVFFAYLIEPLIQLVRRPFENTNKDKYMPRTLAIVMAYLIVFTVLGITIALLTPIVSEQVKQLSINLPGYASSFQEKFRDIGTRYNRYQIPEALQLQINEKAAGLVGAVGTEISELFISSVFYIPWLILVPILAFFFLKDANLFRVSLLRIFPSGDWRSRVESVMSDVNETLAAYTRAQLISCILIGTICIAGFYIIGLDYAVLLGVLAGVLEFIPLIGPITIAITAIAAASLESTWQAVYTLIFLGVLRILQDYVFYPRIIREGVHLHPLAIILSVLAGEQVAGIPGVFLSIPVMALLTVIYKHVLEHSGSKGIVANILAPKENSEETETVESGNRPA
jgi:predicted PurR-regulated permease PerM